jgi:DNA-binding CsgD family transcriptional regulator/PAS domain-containing protein
MPGSRPAGVRLDPEFARRWVEHFSVIDEWFLAWRSRLHCEGPESIATSEELVDPSKLKRTEFFNDYLLPQDTVHQIGGAIVKDGAWFAGFTCLRPESRGPFGPEEVALLQMLFPHLQRAVQFERRMGELEGQQRASLDALDRLTTGVILLDSRGTILTVNRAAQQILDQNDGLTSGRDGIGGSKSLGALIGSAALTARRSGLSEGGSVAVPRPSGKRPFSVLVMPASRDAFAPEAKRPSVIVFVTDPEETPQTTPETLAGLYGLTAAESCLARRLMQGGSLVDSAEHLGVTHNTVRTHLQRIYDKTGTRHQGELIRLLITGTMQIFK